MGELSGGVPAGMECYPLFIVFITGKKNNYAIKSLPEEESCLALRCPSQTVFLASSLSNAGKRRKQYLALPMVGDGCGCASHTIKLQVSS